MNIEKLISEPQLFSEIKKDDICEIHNYVCNILDKRIYINSLKVAGVTTFGNLEIAKASYKKQAEDIIFEAIDTYLIHEKWKTNTPIIPYLTTAINRLARSLIETNNCKSGYASINICPACKDMKMIEELIINENSFICKRCKHLQPIFLELVNGCKSNDADLLLLKQKLNLISVFAEHSITGVKCPACFKFVPCSSIAENKYTCPYPGCNNVFLSSEKMRHPTTTYRRSHLSLNEKKSNAALGGSTGGSKEFIDRLCESSDNAFVVLSKEQDYINKYDIVSSVISGQKQANGMSRKLPNKLAMYEAFEAALKEYPDEMIEYLTVGGQVSGVAIQALIYQKFAEIMQAKLPISIFLKGAHVYIDSVLDEKLVLYNNIRQFTNFIDQNLCIKRKDQYIIENGNLIKNEEKNFIGKLISIKTAEGVDLTPYVESYNFSLINMLNDEMVTPGKDVVVKYYSILPSYTLGSMIHLQRIKKKISESIIKKL